MRAGACTVQQSLGADAAGAIKQAVALARRRGHAQVTPLHVAATLLTSRSSLFRRACMKSQPHPTSHPLQCRALELCCNVALNRLPSTAGPLLQSQPCLSNALVAALKRAQAHQRRGCLDHQQQQQPLLAIKVELDQLIISILDDPSVSRVMREAGLSSTLVKNNLENTVSFLSSYTSADGKEVFPLGSSHNEWTTNWANLVSLNTLRQNPPFLISESPFMNSSILAPNWKISTFEKEDLRMVVDVLLLRRKRNIVLVGDSVSSTEGLVSELKRRIETGDVPEDLRSVKFLAVEFSALSIRIMKKEDVESRVFDLRRVVQNFGMCGLIIYAGNLKWVVEFLEKDAVYRDYNPAEHLITEIARLLSEFSHQSRLWFLGTANTQTYMSCQMRQPSLESQWTLQAVPIPSRSPSLSLHSASGLDSVTRDSHAQQSLHQSEISKSAFIKDDEYDKLILCLECASSYEKEARILLKDEQQHSYNKTENCSSDFPYWLRPYKTGSNKGGSCRELVELKRKWSRLCQSLNHSLQTQLQRKPGEVWFDYMSSGESTSKNNGTVSATSSFGSTFPWRCNSSPNCINKVKEGSAEVKTTLALGIGIEGRHEPAIPNGFKDGDFHNNKKAFLPCNWVAESSTRKAASSKDLCKELLENIPWQSKIIPCIAKAISEPKHIWFLLTGSDWIGKRRLAMTVANSMFGSLDKIYLTMNAGEASVEKIIGYLKSNPHGLIFIEDIDHAKESFLETIRNAIVDGKLHDLNGQELVLTSSIIILTSGSSSANLQKQKTGVIQMKLQVSNNHTDDREGNEMRKRNFETLDSETSEGSRKKQCLSLLDLNKLAQEENEEEHGTDKSVAIIRSDLAQETQHSNMEDNISVSNLFLSKISQHFTLDLPLDSNWISEYFLVKLRRGFTEVLENRRWQFQIEKDVLEELVCASCLFPNCLVEDWIKNVFEKNMEIIKKIGKEESIKVKLCLQPAKEKVLECGYQGSPLPKRVEVVFDYQKDYKLSMNDVDN